MCLVQEFVATQEPIPKLTLVRDPNASVIFHIPSLEALVYDILLVLMASGNVTNND